MFDDDFFMPLMGMTLVPIIILGVMVPFILYIVARWRDHRSPTSDPQLGLKFAMHFFRVQSYQLLLTGLAMLLFSVLMKGEGDRSEIYRTAFGFIVPAAIVFGITTGLLPKTNQDEHPAVGRLFAGYNLMIVGLIGFAAFVMAFQLLFAKGESGNFGRIVWSGVLVYTSAWAIQGILFGRYVMDTAVPPALPPAGPPPSELPAPMQKPLA